MCLVLGDNIFYGQHFTGMLLDAVKHAEEENKATVFGYWVNDPERCLLYTSSSAFYFPELSSKNIVYFLCIVNNLTMVS